MNSVIRQHNTLTALLAHCTNTPETYPM